MAHNFNIEIPTTIQLHIRQAEVIPYLEFKRVPATPARIEPRVDTVWGGRWEPRHSELANQNCIWKIQKWSKERELPVYQLVMPGDWRIMKQKRDILLSNPHYSAAVFFIAGKNWNKVSGHPNGTEMIIIDDHIYRRVTWRSMGHKSNAQGVMTKDADSNQFSYYLIKCNAANRDPLRSIILAGLGNGVFQEPAPEEPANV